MTTFPIDETVRGVASNALGRGLCMECLGRLFGRLGHGLDNTERARRVLEALGTSLPPAAGPCSLCGGLFERLDTWVARALRSAEGYEWKRFTCGSRWDPELLAREEELWRELATPHAESVRGAFNRELGKRIEHATGATGTTGTADIVLLADLPTGRVEVTVLPIYFSGRYRKLDRTLPQTKWPCRRCRGRGCADCNGSGKTYAESVEELIAGPFLAASGGSGSRFHGMGREDIDARMLGDGRPFVLEILGPHRRSLDVPALADAVARAAPGRVEVLGLAPCTAEEVLRVKEASPTKSYRVVICGPASGEKVNEALRVALDRAIAQRTPTRVAHRRADRVRTRRILDAHLVDAAEGRFTLELRAEAGTYIKEWVEGDGGRTEPSLAGLLGTPLSVESLDVIAVHDTEAR